MTLRFPIGVTASSVQQKIFSQIIVEGDFNACNRRRKQCLGILKQRTIPIIMRTKVRRFWNISMTDATGLKLEAGSF